MKTMGLYIHIPFCVKKCHYCDFTSISANESLKKKYVQYINREIRILGNHYKDLNIETVFIGGGTPSVLEHYQIIDILETINRHFNVNCDAEVSIELNPGTVSDEKANAYVESGINRVSIGIQTMDNNTLKLIGRIHNRAQVYSTIEKLRKAGMENINGDLIFGLPHQSVQDFRNTLEEVIDLNLEHISMYGLILEEHTLLYSWNERGLVKMPTEKAEREMYHIGKELLLKNGYYQYEISNFSKKGYECQHNLRYWKLKPYLGIGISSHSSLAGKRYWNHSNFRSYFKSIDMNRLPIQDQEITTTTMEESEYLILGIRLNEGISMADYKKKFNVSFMGKYGEVVEKHKESGLLEHKDGRLYLTEKGKDLSNQVEMDFIP